MKANHSGILSQIYKYTIKPPLFEPGEARFWDDPHISKSMLEAHLNPSHDAASRRPGTIDKEVNHLISSGILKPRDRLLDLGCGPGLYASRFAAKGIKVTGVDISERSLNYAIAQSKEKGLDIEYRSLNFFDMDYTEEFDAVLQAHGELATFSDEKRGRILSIVHRALKPGGLFVFDVTAAGPKAAEEPQWYIADGGFWRPGMHLVLEKSFVYSEAGTHVDQYVVADEKGVAVYRTWIRHYTLRTLRPALKKAGFNIEKTWNDLCGTPYRKGGDWLAVAARKR
jgi:SAM-dependent methyltransferase